MIKDNINGQIGNALKAHDEIRLTTLRMLSSALNYEFIAKQHELTDDEEIAVVRREVKKRNDTVETYKQLSEKDPEGVAKKIEREIIEVKILKEYLPPEMDEGELNDLVIEAISQTEATQAKDMGKVIAAVKSKVGSSVDGKRIADLVKAKLLK
jgi:uncharacterized protein YqeY